MKLAIIVVGNTKESYFREAAEEYIKRLRTMEPVEVVRVPVSNVADEAAPGAVEKALEQEGQRILKALRDDDLAVALAWDGKSLDSVEFSRFISGQQPSGQAVDDSKRLVFIIGSSQGLSPAVFARCQVKLSLSPLTFPHQLALIVLLEQIYRGQMIAKGRSYHK